jgi:hypothetical protein
MPWRPHGPAEVDPDSPRAWATCDRCGWITNHYKLGWQYQYAGTALINKQILVCQSCMDIPAPFMKTIIIPADPKPIMNARPEPYAIDQTQVRMVQDGTPRVTEDEEDYRLPDSSVTDANEDTP